jgi:flagellar motility protein MotE (MotC chaperone)
MKAVKLLLVAVVLFSAAAGGSWYLQNHMRAESDAPGKTPESAKDGKRNAAAGSSASGGDTKTAKAAFRPPYTPDAEKIAKVAENLQQQTESHKAREQQLLVRQKNLEVILQDIRSEQKSLDDVRKSLNEELKLLTDKMIALDKKSQDAKQQGIVLDGQRDEIKKGKLEVSRVEKKQFESLGKVYDAMEVDAASQTLLELVEKGKMDTAVKLLYSMKAAQAAQVLAKLSSNASPVAAELVQRYLAIDAASKKSP